MIQSLQPPAGYDFLSHQGRLWIIQESARAALLDLPLDDPDALAARSEARPRHGRATHWSVATPVGRVLIRAGRRGGVLGPLLGRWYLGMGAEPRCARELGVSHAARAAGVATPEILAAVWEAAPAGLYRGWILVREIPDAIPFIRLWTDVPTPDRAAAACAAGDACAALHNAGIVHPDLNATNILLSRANGSWRAWIIDLDRARHLPRLSPPQRAWALWRLVRSCLKYRAAGAPVSWLAAPQFLKAYVRRAACGAGPMRRALRSVRPWVRAKWWLSDALRISRPAPTPMVSWRTSQ